MLSTHSGRLERFIGSDRCEQLSAAMKDWYGPPIALGDVPGAVWVCKGGDFRGRIAAGQMAPLIDYYEQRVKRILRNASRRQMSSLHAGFSSLSDLINEATVGGKKRTFIFQKAGVAADAIGGSVSLWGVGNVPPAGANASNAPGGDAPDDSTTGAFPFTNPAGGDTQHIVGGSLISSVATRNLLLYDRLFQVNKTMNSTATEAVTGVPTRYQSQTPGDQNYIGGNFAFPEVGGTVLPATAHNHTVCTYTDQGGAASTFPSIAGVASMNVRCVDLPAGQWFMPLEAGDVGVKALTQIQLDALVATGVLNYVVGHPLAFLSASDLNLLYQMDGIMTAFNLTRIFDDAALALMQVISDTTTATTFNGSIETVAG